MLAILRLLAAFIADLLKSRRQLEAEILFLRHGTAHLVQMFDSTVVRAHVSAAGAKGGKMIKRSAVRAAVSRRKSI